MDCEVKKYWRGWRFYATFSLRRVVEVRGVNSRVNEKTHFLMWDFDGTPLKDVLLSLRGVQARAGLPGIDIISTGKAGGYHAYCFKACSWEQARGIVAMTPGVDKNYLAIAIGRGYFTLRFSDVPGRTFEHVFTLTSDVVSDLSYSDVCSFVEYTRTLKPIRTRVR